MGGLGVLTVLLWVFGGALIDPTTVALVAISLMLILRLVSWDDVAGNRAAWSTLVLLAALVALADGLGRVGFIAWFAQGSARALTGLRPVAALAGRDTWFFFVH